MNKAVFAVLAGTAALSLSACDVEQTKEGEAPSIDVDADAGALPEYDVDAPDVDVTTEEKTVEVPVIEVEEADAGKKGE